jgi:leucine dehydrogenase
MNIQSLLADWDGESVIIQHDKPTGTWIVIAIHNADPGRGLGGTRMKPYPDLAAAVADAIRLAEAMTYKFALACFPAGGAKAVLAVPPDLDVGKRPGLLRRYGTLIQSLGGRYGTGPDVGTSPADMDIIAETGAPYVHARSPQKGGSGDSGPPTALGVFFGIQAALAHLLGDDSLRGRRIVVQGAGGVGRHLIDRLCAAEAEVSFTDVDEAAIRWGRDEMGLAFVPPEAVYDATCDIFAPCALGGVLNRNTIPRLQCRAVVGAANNQLAGPDDAAQLQARGILYAPDYAVNLGGALAVTGIEAEGWSRAEAEAKVAGIRNTLGEIFALAEEEGITTNAAAQRIARSRLVT